MTDLLRRTGSPASRARSPGYERCSNGMEYLRAKARTSNVHERNRRSVSPGSHALQTDMLSVPMPSHRSRSTERPGSSKAKFGIPQITVTEVSSSSSRNNHSDMTLNKARSRSASPFDWIEREKLPCGSPTFERVKSDMLSDSETSPMNSDTEQTIIVNSTRTKKRTSKTSQTKSYYTKNRGKFKY